MNNKVLVYFDEEVVYPSSKFSYCPNANYPEYPFGSNLSDEKNLVYDTVRNALFKYGLDKENFGSPKWNPLGDYAKPGDFVVVKPNLVMDNNPMEQNGETNALITNPSVVRVIIDFLIIAMKGQGKIIIGDAPLQKCDFEKLKRDTGYNILLDFYQKKKLGIDVEFKDFRNVTVNQKNGTLRANCAAGDEGIKVNLEKSSFSNLGINRFKKLRVTDYNPSIMINHHNENVNEYLISADVLNADLIVNLPKPKTHKKAGITAAMKNLVGINTNKEWLPHHSIGSIAEGGDEYCKKSLLRNFSCFLMDQRNKADSNQAYFIASFFYYFSHGIDRFYRIFHPKTQSEGSWYGNDTIWRTILDLNRVVFFADKKGIIRENQQRKNLILGDMIIAGEKEGPMTPSPKACKMIVIGENPLLFDECISAIMGFDCKLIPYLLNARNKIESLDFLTKDAIAFESNFEQFNANNCSNINYQNSLKFIPSIGWMDILGH